jgi:alkyl sulfatase BDS1-like metallo-beta-lactamase superfamily hydrolase
VKLDFDVHAHLQRLTTSQAHGNDDVDGAIFLGLQVNGRGGGQWELTLHGGKVVSASQGLSDRCTATYYLNSRTFQTLAKRESSVDRLLGAGSVLIEGNGVPLNDLTGILQGIADGKPVGELAGNASGGV